MFPFRLPVILYAYIFERSDNCVITSAINKRFELVDKSQMWLKVNTNTGSKVEVSNKITSIIHGTSSCGLSVRNIYKYRYYPSNSDIIVLFTLYRNQQTNSHTDDEVARSTQASNNSCDI